MTTLDRIQFLLASPTAVRLPWSKQAPIAVDGAAIAPGALAECEFGLLAERLELAVVDPPAAWLAQTGGLEQQWLRRNPSARNDRKVGLVRLHLRGHDPTKYQFTIAFTRWSQVRAVHELMTPIASHDLGSDSSLLPNILSMHVVVKTSDNAIVANQRAQSVAYHPGTVSCSLEEGVEPQDLNAGAWWLHAAAARGVNEELLSPGAIAASDVTILGPLLEIGLRNPAVAALVTVPHPSTELQRLAMVASDEGEAAGEPLFLSAEPAHIAEVLLERMDAPAQQRRRPWHPTSRARLLMLLVHQIGLSSTARLLHDLSSS